MKPANQMSLAAYLGNFFQLAYVTNDLEKAISYFRDDLEVKEFARFESTMDVVVQGVPGKAQIKVGLARVNDTQIEIIEPVSGAVDIYRDSLPAVDGFALTFHHLGFKVLGDDTQWQHALETMRAKGHTFSVLGEVAPIVKFGYVDMRDKLGHFVELVQFSADLQAQMNQLPDQAA
jgi:hypothetical protein